MSYRDHDEVDEWELIYPEDVDELDDLNDEDEEEDDEDEDFQDEDDFEDDDFDDEDADDDEGEIEEDDEADFEFADEPRPVKKPTEPARHKSTTKTTTTPPASKDSPKKATTPSKDVAPPAEKLSASARARSRREALLPSSTSLRVLSEKLADECEESLGYRFKDRRKLEHGLTHSSIARTRLESNERLEFLGDSIMGAVICEELYRQFPDLPEGEMTRIKSAVVSRLTCAKVAKKIELNRYLLLGRGFPARDRLPGSIIAGAYEAIVAAIYLDGGFDAAKKFVLDTLNEEVTKTARSAHAQNYKSHLQQMAQRHFGQTPNYRVNDEKGPDHSKCFEIAVSIGGRLFPSAWGPSKKEAEQNAARAAIEIIAEEKGEVVD